MKAEETVDFVKYYLYEKSTGIRISCPLQDKYKKHFMYKRNYKKYNSSLCVPRARVCVRETDRHKYKK